LAEGGLAPPESGPFPDSRSQGTTKGYCWVEGKEERDYTP